MKKFHIGKKIKEVFYKKPMTMVEFTRRIGVSRASGYSIFRAKSMQTAKLDKIGNALDHNFFKYYSELFNHDSRK